MHHKPALSRSLSQLHEQYNEVLHRIVRHARVYFRWIKCWHTKEDKIQEVRSHCWKWIKQLHKAGKKWWLFVSRLADYACRAVRSGRRVAGMISAKDVFNEITQSKKGFYVGKLPDFSTLNDNPLQDALADNTVSEVPDQVIFRIDFPSFRETYPERNRSIMDDMMIGEGTKHLAEKYKMSQGRISQLRRQFYEGWGHFHGEAVNDA